MDQESINLVKYKDLNRWVIGFLSIIVLLSSALAGCVTYQFINYTNTKVFLMVQLRGNNASCEPRADSIRKRRSRRSRPQPSEKRISKTNPSIFSRRTSEILNEKNGLGELELKAPPQSTKNYDLKNSTIKIFNKKLPSQLPPRLTTTTSTTSTTTTSTTSTSTTSTATFILKNKSDSLLAFYHLFIQDKFDWIAFLNLALNLTSFALEIYLFKSLVHSALLSAYPTKVYYFPQLLLIIINFLISTTTRVYFARLGSTMLRSPKHFLIISLVLLLFTLIGTIIQIILVHAQLINYDQIKNFFNYKKNQNQNFEQNLHSLLEIDFFLNSIQINKLLMGFFQLVWIGSVFIWHLAITGVLLFNFCDIRKRCRFGSADGKVSLGIMLLFETLSLSTAVTCIFFCGSLVLGGRLGIDFQRLSTIQIGFDSIIARLNSISIFCSFQHRVNDGILKAQSSVLTYTSQETTLSGIGIRPGEAGGGESDLYSPRRHSRLRGETVGPQEGEEENLDVDVDCCEHYELKEMSKEDDQECGDVIVRSATHEIIEENSTQQQQSLIFQQQQPIISNITKLNLKEPQKALPDLNSIKKYSLEVDPSFVSCNSNSNLQSIRNGHEELDSLLELDFPKPVSSQNPHPTHSRQSNSSVHEYLRQSNSSVDEYLRPFISSSSSRNESFQPKHESL